MCVLSHVRYNSKTEEVRSLAPKKVDPSDTAKNSPYQQHMGRMHEAQRGLDRHTRLQCIHASPCSSHTAAFACARASRLISWRQFSLPLTTDTANVPAAA